VEIESKKCSWRWVTATELLSHGPCELIYARTMSAAAESATYLYDGENTNGTLIVQFIDGILNGLEFSPKVPVYCRKGLYFVKGTGTTGIFVQWRELGHKEGG
jgi:hypothetical protein